MPPYAPHDSTDRGGNLEFRTTVLVILAGLVLLNLPPAYQDSIAAGLRGTLLRPFLAVQEGLVSAQNRAVEAEVLQAQIDSLTAIAVGSTTLAEENRRLRGLLELSGRLGPSWSAVQVLRPGTPDSESMLIVDAGVDDGILERSPLITREGLVGVVRTSSRDQAVGMDWTHPDFRASAMTVDGLQYGLVRSSRAFFADESRLILEGVPFHAEVEPGTVVVTSGLGGVFPRGIPIGRIADAGDAEAEWRRSFWLEPFVEVGSVTLALVGLPPGGAYPDSTTVEAGTGRDAQAQVRVPDARGGWADGEYLRAEEREARVRLLSDSLAVLRDSLARLQGRSGAPEDGQ